MSQRPQQRICPAVKTIRHDQPRQAVGKRYYPGRNRTPLGARISSSPADQVDPRTVHLLVLSMLLAQWLNRGGRRAHHFALGER